MQTDDSHAACGPPFVSHSCRRVGPQHGRGDVEAGLPHPASALRPSPAGAPGCRRHGRPPCSDAGRERWPPCLSTQSGRGAVPAAFRAPPEHLPNARQGCSFAPGVNPFLATRPSSCFRGNPQSHARRDKRTQEPTFRDRGPRRPKRPVSEGPRARYLRYRWPSPPGRRGPMTRCGSRRPLVTPT